MCVSNISMMILQVEFAPPVGYKEPTPMPVADTEPVVSFCFCLLLLFIYFNMYFIKVIMLSQKFKSVI